MAIVTTTNNCCERWGVRSRVASVELERPLPRLHGVDNLLRRDFAEVDMRGREIRMSELLLNYIDRCVLAREFPCVGMTQPVKMNPLLDVRLSS